MIFETHAHIEDHKFDEDREAVLQMIHDSGISTLVNVGSTIETSKKSIALAESHDWIYASVGVHPEEMDDMKAYGPQIHIDATGDDSDDVITGISVEDVMESKGIRTLRELAANPKVVAIGEFGLDYYWIKDPEERELQKKWFRAQLALAKELSLPVIIHSREAAADTMEIMKEAAAEGISGVIHCYSYSAEQAKEYVKMGYFIGIGGAVTFKNSKKLQAVAEQIPLTSIVLETDSPYMAPVPNRGKRNDSSNLVYVAQKIAEIKGVSYDEVVRVTEENARRLYPKCEKVILE